MTFVIVDYPRMDRPPIGRSCRNPTSRKDAKTPRKRREYYMENAERMALCDFLASLREGIFKPRHSE